MALIMLREEFISEFPNILYVMECYFDDLTEVYQEDKKIVYRVQGDGLPQNDEFVRMTIDNTDNFLQIIKVE